MPGKSCLHLRIPAKALKIIFIIQLNLLYVSKYPQVVTASLKVVKACIPAVPDSLKTMTKYVLRRNPAGIAVLSGILLLQQL